ncbi:hypothetical protein PFISCL1PPCAC_17178, partial [Pristionchus fissidentatus]
MFSPPLPTFVEPGPGNSSRWIHTVARLRYLAGLEPLYYFLVSTETPLLRLKQLVRTGSRNRKCPISQPVHENLIFITLQQLLIHELSIVARFVIILYESGLVRNGGLAFEPVPTMCVIRLLSYTHVVFFNIVVFIERYLATRFVCDYEGRRRLHIPIVINVSLLLFSIAYGYRVVWAQSNAYFWTGASLIPNTLAVFGFWRILKANERRLRRLNDHLNRQHYCEYSLSLRLQLKENIWSIRELRKCLIFTFAIFAVYALVIFLPPIILQSKDTRTTLEVLVAIGNLLMATAVPVIGCGICAMNERARQHLLPAVVYRRELEERRASIDEYFEILFTFWDEVVD